MISYKQSIDKTTKKLKDNVYIIKEIPLSDDDIYITLYPTVPLTHIAQTYYNDVDMWKLLAYINNLTGIYVSEETTIRIPLGVQVLFEED